MLSSFSVPYHEKWATKNFVLIVRLVFGWEARARRIFVSKSRVQHRGFLHEPSTFPLTRLSFRPLSWGSPNNQVESEQAGSGELGRQVQGERRPGRPQSGRWKEDVVGQSSHFVPRVTQMRGNSKIIIRRKRAPAKMIAELTAPGHKQQSNKREMSEENLVRAEVSTRGWVSLLVVTSTVSSVCACARCVCACVCMWRKRASHQVPDQEHGRNTWDLDTCVYRDSWN